MSCQSILLLGTLASLFAARNKAVVLSSHQSMAFSLIQSLVCKSPIT